MRKIVLASNNKHKVKEFKEMLGNVEILTLESIGFTEDIEETGKTFEENALIKARTIKEYLKGKNLDYAVVADDSGLCCEALNGAPGIYSARYAGDHDNEKNRAKLREDLQGKDRTAYFICTIAFIDEEGKEQIFVGKTYGTIINEELGNKDFCFDCMFHSDDLDKTFGESTEEEKNSVSHRSRAIEKLKEVL